MPKRKARAEEDEGDDYLYNESEAAGAHAGSSHSHPEDDVKPVPRGGKRAKKATHGTPEERRLARFRAKCPKNIEERLDRVQSQRFFLIGRERNGEELAEKFLVLGSTGNVYTVNINHLPTCDCPDALKGNHCKHILFVFLRVLGQSANSSFIYQKALLTSELAAIFANAPANPSAAHNPNLVKAYKDATGSPSKAEANDNEEVAPAPNRKIPGEDDSCPICYEDIFKEDLSHFVFCEVSCGGAIHKDCFQRWATSTRAKGDDVTCVFCRALWPVQGTGKQGQGVDSELDYAEGYLNLAGAAGISRNRDTSSYYHGVAKSRSYGYGDRYDGFGYGYRGRYR